MIESKETLTGNIISKQTISGNTNAKEIKVLPTLEDLTITPTKAQQVFNHENCEGYDNVTVNPIPDEYIIPEGTLPITENTTYDVTNYARVSASVHPAPNLQDKEVTPTKEVQTITSDENYDGLNEVKVNPIPDSYIEPSGTLDITENGTYDVKQYAETTVNVEGSSGSGGGTGQAFPILGIDEDTVINGTQAATTSRSLTLHDFNNFIEQEAKPNIALVFWFCRSECTISDNVIEIYESETFSIETFNQKLHIGYMPYVNGATITVTQETSGRIGLGYIPLCNCDVPVIVQSQLINDEVSTDYYINADEHLNIYIATSIYTISMTSNLNLPSGGGLVGYSSRLGYFISNCAIKDAKLSNEGLFLGNIVQVRCPVKTS